MKKRLSRDDASESSSSSSSNKGRDDNEEQDGEYDADSNQEQVVAGDRHYHKDKLLETPSSNRAHHTASVNDGKGTHAEQLASSSGTTAIVVASRKDVLLGRGRPYQNFGGNKRMLRIVSRFKEEYAARPRDQKRLFVETVLDVVLKDGTRFLRRVDESEDGSSDQWAEVDRSTAADKVWHALRSKDRSMKSKDKWKTFHQEGNVDDKSVVSRSSRMKNEEHHDQRHILADSREITTGSSSDGMMGLVRKHASSKPLQERSQERDGSSISIPPTVESLTQEIAYHLNKTVEATNLLSALIGAPMHLPSAASASSPLTMHARASQTADTRAGGLQARQQHGNSTVEEAPVMNNNAMFLAAGEVAAMNSNAMSLPAGSSLGASAPCPLNNQVQSNALLLPFSSLAGLVPYPSAAQYLTTLSNGGAAAGGLVGPSVSATFPDARQIAQMTALYPRIYSGGQATPANVASSSSNQQFPSTGAPGTTLSATTTMDRNQQMLLQALAILSRQAAQHAAGQSPAPPR